MKRQQNQNKYYHISSVARLYNVHPQTLRLYEREGLLKPSRSEGNTRLYSEEDLKQLEVILNLTRDLGVNLAGIEVILNMRKKIERIETEVNEFLDYIRKEFFKDQQEEFDFTRKALVRIKSSKLVKLEVLEKSNE
jgi:MerR family transcriptional regulator/heat shock protein HspR